MPTDEQWLRLREDEEEYRLTEASWLASELRSAWERNEADAKRIKKLEKSAECPTCGHPYEVHNWKDEEFVPQLTFGACRYNLHTDYPCDCRSLTHQVLASGEKTGR